MIEMTTMRLQAAIMINENRALDENREMLMLRDSQLNFLQLNSTQFSSNSHSIEWIEIQ